MRSPAPRPDAPVRDADLGFEPTPTQARAKAQFWRKFRDDPSMEPEDLTPGEIKRFISCAELDTWWKQPNFKSWFLHQDSWRDAAQATFEKTIRQIERRLESSTMSDKDLLGAAKLLAEITNNIPRVGSKDEGKKTPQLTGPEALARLRPILIGMGWIPPAQLSATDVEASDVTQ